MDISAKKIVIGIDAKRAFCNFTGLGNYSRNHIRSLLHFDSHIHLVLLTPQIKNAHFLEELKPFQHRLKIITPENFISKKLHSLWRSFKLPTYFSPHHIQIFLGPSHELPLFPKKRAETYEIVTIHDLIFLRRPELFPWIDRQLYKRKWIASCARADKIIAISQQTRDDLIDMLNVPAEKIEIIHQNIDISFFQTPSSDLIQEVQKKYQLVRPFFLYVGDFNPRKNILHTIESYARSQSRKEWDLVLVGPTKGSYHQKVRELIKKLHVEDSVKVFGYVPFNELISLYHLAEVLVYPSLFEGFGIPLVEAQAQRTAIITSKNCGLEDAAGPHSLYVSPFDTDELALAMDELSASHEKRNMMKERGQQYAFNFHPQVIAEKWVKCYQALSKR